MASKRSLALLTTAIAGTTVLVGCSEGGTSSESYPQKNISVVVPFSAGGPTDVAARAAAPCMEEALGTTLVIENRTGGGGSIGTGEVARSAADGYRLVMLTAASAVMAPLENAGAGYTVDDFDPIGTISKIPSGIIVPENSPFNTADDLFEAARNGSVTVGVAGATTTYGLELQQLNENHGMNFQVVPFEGGSKAEVAMLGGNVDALFAAVTDARVDAMQAGDIKILVTGGNEPVSYLPDVPTIQDAGYESVVDTTEYFSLAGPTGLPEDVSSQLSETLETCLSDEEVISVIGEESVPDDFINGEETAEAYADLNQAVKPLVES